MTVDEQLHYLGGFALALPWRVASLGARVRRVRAIDLMGWNREVAQHDYDLNPNQVAEARAWGRGARAALGISPLYPCPPYPS